MSYYTQSITRLNAPRFYHFVYGWNEIFTNYLYSHKCKKNAKQNRLMFFEFWKHYMLNHSVWHFSSFVTIKIVGEPKQQYFISATNEVIESRCVQSCNSILNSMITPGVVIWLKIEVSGCGSTNSTADHFSALKFSFSIFKVESSKSLYVLELYVNWKLKV